MTVVYEVFRRERAGAAMQHAGSVAAPDARFAEIYAREQYGRRGESEALWLVPRDAVQEVAEFVDEFDLKYRRVDGYSIKERLKEARERAGTTGLTPSSSPTTTCAGNARADATHFPAREPMTDKGRVELLLELADDELVLGWRNSEWTGIAPFLEEDVAFSSIAQNEIGHARALYELVARELGTDADAVAFDRPPEQYRSAPLVELRRLEWALTIARHWLYETADAVRLEALQASDDAELAGIAAKMAREEVYHRIHADMWLDRLLASDEGRPRLEEALEELWPYALGVLDEELRPEFVRRVEARLGRSQPDVDPVGRDRHEAELAELLDEMTSVRRSAPAGARW